MDFIKVKDSIIRVDTFEWQTDILGRKFKTIGVSKNGQMPEKWCNNKKCFLNHWYYRFKYDSGEYFTIEIDYNNKFVQLIKGK